MIKSVQSKKRKAYSTRAQQAKAHLHAKIGPSTTVGGAQAQPPAHLAKAVARRASQGAVRPRPILLRRLHGGMLGRFSMVSKNTCAKLTMD